MREAIVKFRHHGGHQRSFCGHKPLAALLGNADELLRRSLTAACPGRGRSRRDGILVKCKVDRFVRLVQIFQLVVQRNAASPAVFEHGEDDQRCKRREHDGADDDEHDDERAVPSPGDPFRWQLRRGHGGRRRIRCRGIGNGEHRTGQHALRAGRVHGLDGKRQVARRTDDQFLFEDRIAVVEHIVCGQIAQRGFRQDGVDQLDGAGVADDYAHAHGAGLRRPWLQDLRQQGHAELRIVHKRMHLIGLLVLRLVCLAERVGPRQMEGDVAHRFRGDGDDEIGIGTALARIERKRALVYGVAQLVRNANIGHGLVAVVHGGDGEGYAGGGGRAHLHVQINLYEHHRQRDGLDGGKRLGLPVDVIGDDGRRDHVVLPHRIDIRLGKRAARVERVVAQDGVVADLLVDDRDIGHVKLGFVGKLVRQDDRIALFGVRAVHRARDGDDRFHRARDGHRHLHGERLPVAQPAHLKQQFQPDLGIRHFIKQRKRRRTARRNHGPLHSLDGKDGIVKTDGDLVQLKIGIVGDFKRKQHRAAFGQLGRVRRHLDAHLVVRKRGRTERTHRQHEHQAQQRRPQQLSLHCIHSSSDSSGASPGSTGNARMAHAPACGITRPSVRSTMARASASQSALRIHATADTATS